MLAGKPVVYDTTTAKDGRTFGVRRVDAHQDGAHVFTMTCSFAADADAGGPGTYEYELPPVEPDGDRPRPGDEGFAPEGWNDPVEQMWLGSSERRADGTMTSTHRSWIRATGDLPALEDDAAPHAALIAYISDMTGYGGRPLLLEPPEGTGIEGMISLDHAVWFHRPARADQWLFFDVHSLVNTAGRGVLRGTLRDLQGKLVASLAQEMLLIPPSV